MKKLALIAALLLASASAHASTYRSGRNAVVVPHGCYSWSCISVSVPGHYSHNVHRSPQAHHRRSKSNNTASTTAAPAVVTPSAVPQNPGSNITVLPAPAQQ